MRNSGRGWVRVTKKGNINIKDIEYTYCTDYIFWTMAHSIICLSSPPEVMHAKPHPPHLALALTHAYEYFIGDLILLYWSCLDLALVHLDHYVLNRHILMDVQLNGL